MSNVVNIFGNKGFKLSHEEAMRLAKSSAFPPQFKVDYKRRADFYERRYKDYRCQFYALKEELRSTSLWDKIFNWRY